MTISSAVYSCLLLCGFGGEVCEVAQHLAKEVEFLVEATMASRSLENHKDSPSVVLQDAGNWASMSRELQSR